jgi:transposase InsO family protein
VAAEAGISRRCLSKWYGRWRELGEAGLEDRSSKPRHSPNATREGMVELVVAIRRAKKWGPARIAASLEIDDNIIIAPATVHRILQREGLSRLRDIDPPTGEQLRVARRYEHEAPGDMVHVDIKKMGRIPVGGGWRVHGRDSEQARASKRGGVKVGYIYVHSAVDDYSRLAYSESLNDEKGETAAAFWLRMAHVFYEYGIDDIKRALTDNGSCYRSHVFAAALAETHTVHKRTRPFTPRTNGKVERYNGTIAREWAYVTEYASEEERSFALPTFLNYYNHERPHHGLGLKPPVSRLPTTLFQLGSAVWPAGATSGIEIEKEQHFQIPLFETEPTS